MGVVFGSWKPRHRALGSSGRDRQGPQGQMAKKRLIPPFPRRSRAFPTVPFGRRVGHLELPALVPGEKTSSFLVVRGNGLQRQRHFDAKPMAFRVCLFFRPKMDFGFHVGFCFDKHTRGKPSPPPKRKGFDFPVGFRFDLPEKCSKPYCGWTQNPSAAPRFRSPGF